MNRVDNRIIQSFWYGEALSPLERLCIQSFLTNGHEFHLYLYAPVENIPNGCIIKNANEIVNSSAIFLDSRGGIASFSDYFRMKLLYAKGGWWVDMDIICLQYFEISEEYAFSSEYSKGDIFPNIGCIKSPKGSLFIEEYIGIIEERLGREGQIIWGTFGPKLMKELLELYDSKIFIHAPEDFITPSPLVNSDLRLLSFHKIVDTMNDMEFETCLKSYSVHLYNELWNRYNFDKAMLYTSTSLFERLKTKYKIS